jgi:hypothetical protein
MVLTLPVGQRDPDGIHAKVGLDDFILTHGVKAFHQIMAESRKQPTAPIDLDSYREHIGRSRIESLPNPGVYSDGSPPGAGKTFADLEAMKRVVKSLLVLPSHSNCREVESLCASHNIDAVAYPEISRKTCDNYDEAERALDAGLSVSQAICPGCRYKDGCIYQFVLKLADKSNHRIATHCRAGLSFDQIANGREYISIHEDPTDVLRPGFNASSGLGKVARVADEAITLSIRRQSSENPDRSEEYFFRRMYDISIQLIDQLASTATTTILELPVSAAMQRGSDRRLIEAMESTGIWTNSDPLQLVKMLAAGEADELVVRVDDIFTKGGKKRTERSLCVVKQTQLPTNSVTWISDATSHHDDLEAMAGRSIQDMTPAGRLESRHPLLQIAGDITKATSRPKVLGIIRSILSQLPHNRVGIICHREHISAVDGTARKDPVLEDEFRSLISRTDYFRCGESRGSNAFIDDCDFLLILGTPRVPPPAIKDRLFQLGLAKAAARDAKWVGWGRDYWSAVTTSGKRITVKTFAYRDRDWHRSHQSIVQAELIQSVGRGRSILENGIPTIVVTTENLGLKILDIELCPLTNSQIEIISAMELLSGESPKGIEAGLSGESAKGIYLGLSPLSSNQIAESAKKDLRWVIRILNGLSDRGFVDKVGERGGWILTQPPMIDLYAAAGCEIARPASSSRVSRSVPQASSAAVEAADDGF